MKKVMLLVAMIFSFTALTFAKSTPTASDISKKVTAELTKQNKALASDAAFVNAFTQKAQEQIQKGQYKKSTVTPYESEIEITITITVAFSDGSSVTLTITIRLEMAEAV